jgi:hypothetical protein
MCWARKNSPRAERHLPPSPLCGILPLQQVAPAQNQAETSSLDQLTSTSPLRNRRQRERLPFIDYEAKKSALDDLKFLTAHPEGSRHPRVYTLIGRGNLAPSPQRGTLSRPAAVSQGKLTRRERQPIPCPLPPPKQAEKSRQDMQSDPIDPYTRVRAIRDGMQASRMSTSSQAKQPQQESQSDPIDPYARVRAI